MIVVFQRITFAILGAVALTAIGYLSFVASMHNSNPFLTGLTWVGIPLFQIGIVFDWLHANTSYWLAILAGTGLWFLVLVKWFSISDFPKSKSEE